MSHKQALIFGASGIAGWSFTRECLVHPTTSTFDRVIALSYRALDKNFFTFNANNGYDDSKIQAELGRLDIYDGIDLSNNSVSEKIANISGVENTTHVFYSAYAGHEEAYGSSNPFSRLTEINLALLKEALAAVMKSCPKLEFWLQISGTKSYGFELGGIPGFPSVAPSLPWKESDLPLPAPFGDMVFYNAQHAELERQSKGKWKFAELIPNMIIGFCPRLNSMSWAQPLALFLSFYKEYSGSTEISWPGSEATYTCLVGDSFQDIIGRAAIHVALSSQDSGLRVNISDLEKPISTETIWKETCSYFGLTGSGPNANGEVVNTKWLLDRKSDWPAFEEKHGLKKGIMEDSPWAMLQLVFDINFARYVDLDVIRKLGFNESQEHFAGYKIAFERLKAAKFLP